jgi:two-component system, OmpR family, sensor histidine kinase CpxA
VHRLFLKIFLWFWTTVILVGIALVLSFVLGPRGSYLPWQDVRGIGSRVVREMDRHGARSAGDLLARLQQSQGLEACLYDENGQPVAGNHCASFQQDVERAAHSPGLNAEPRAGVYRNLLRLRSGSGKTYMLASELPYGPSAVHRTVASFVTHWIVVLLVSSAVCYLLTHRLTEPILRLREASRQIADGNLQARVDAKVEERGDEFGDLGRDFNTMAGRIEDVLSSQRQLISDVSHELRSPLTRINLALDIARRRLGNDDAFDRMSADLEKLEEMIGRLLTMARLEAGAAPAQWETTELSGLVTEIVTDAQMEARERSCEVICRSGGAYRVRADENLLRSAVENVVRNAVHYADAGTEILVTLSQRNGAGKGTVLLDVSDRGPGVPESETENIFRPFYRVEDARDRQSGGAGLGLAIAARVIQLHQGKVSARNREGGGLQVTIELPLA